MVAFGVFIHRSDSIYEDSPAERYQFPSQYLARVQACIGDWIIYYEPVKARDSRGYFAIAKIQQVIPDPATPGMHIAVIEAGSYLDFANPVPFRDADGLIERGLLNEQGKISGRAQSAVRPISPADFTRITELGLAENTSLLPRVDTTPAFPSMHIPIRAGTEPRRLFDFAYRPRQHLSPHRPAGLRLPVRDHLPKTDQWQWTGRG